MTKKTRTVLFLICLFLFLLIAPVTIFYSQGYRFDIDSKKITQTGGLFLKIEPKQVEIYINGKLKKKTDFFFGSALIENLLPKKYKVEIKKEGYHPWEKNLEIKEKQVTEVKNIVLFSENPTFNILTAGVKNFWFSPDEKKIILFEESEMGWALKLYDLEKNVKSQLIEERDFYSKGADLLNLEFSEDSNEIYLDIGMKEKEKYFTLKLNKFPPTLTEREIATSSENIIASQVFNGDSYYLDKSGYLFKNEERLTENPFPVKVDSNPPTTLPSSGRAPTEYVLEIFQNFVFLRENQTLYQFNPDLKSFEKFFENINFLKISPDLKKIVYFSNSEIWILFLKEVVSQPIKKSGEKVFLVRLSEKINDVFWLNSDYLVFNTGNKIKVAEIDDRDRINMVDIAEFPPTINGGGPEIFFSQSSKKLYILSNGNLYTSETL